MTRKEIEQVLENSGRITRVDNNLWAEHKKYAIMVEFFRDDELLLVINDEKTMCRTNYHLGEITNLSIDKEMFDNEEFTEITLNTIFGNQNRFLIEC